MTVTALDHPHVENADWPGSWALWEELDRAVVAGWGSDGPRAGRVVAGAAAVVWGTRLRGVTDPDGCTVAAETAP